MGKTRETGNIVSDGLVSVDIANDQFKVGTGVTIYGSSGIISATSLYVDGIEITGSGLFESTATGIHTLSSVGIGTTARGNALSVGGTITELYNGTYWNVVTQADVGYGASQVPLNQYLGQLAFLDDYHPNGLRRDGGGSDDVSVTSAGLVGINTTNPNEELHVLGAAVISSDAATLGDDYSTLTIGERPQGDGYASLSFKNDTNSFTAKIDGTSSGLSIWGNKNSVLSSRFVWDGSASTEKVLLRPRGQTVLHAQHDGTSGKVGINSTSPTEAFDVDGGAHVSGNISVGSTTNIIRKVTDINSWVAVDSDTSFSVTSQQNAPTGLYFKSNGTKMFVVGTQSPRDVEEYALSIAWDITTASHTTAHSINSQDTSPQGLYFSPNGENMFVAGNSSNSILHYTLSTGWDLSSTINYEGNFSVSSQATLPTGVTFGDSGTKMYVVGRTNDSIHQYNLSSAYTITSGVTHAHTLDVSASSIVVPNGLSNPHGISISSDGTKIWVIDAAEDIIAQINLGTAYDLSTATYNGDFTNILWTSSTGYDFYIDESAEKGFVLFAGADDSVREIDIANSGLLIEANPTVRSANINLNNNVQVKGKTWFEDSIIVNGSQTSYFQHSVQVQGSIVCRGLIDLADGSADRIQFGESDDAKIYYDGTDNYFDLQFSSTDNNGFRILDNSDSELFRVANDGKVGIGTDAPNTKLDVAGDISIRNGDQLNVIRTNSAGKLQFLRNAASNNQIAVTIDDDSGDIGIGTDSPTVKLDVYDNTSGSGTTGGTTLLNLRNYVGNDLNQQKTFIDFIFTDDNNNETPQVRIGAEVGENGDANSETLEGSGAFVVYTNDSDTTSGAAGASLAERFRVDYAGNVGINTNAPLAKLEVKDGSVYVPGGSFNASSLGEGNESKTDAALVIDRGSAIYFQDNGYLRNLIETDFTALNIGQHGTSYISEINLKPGNASSNGVKLHHGGNADNVKLQTTVDGVKVLNDTSETAVISGPQNIILDPSPDDVVAIAAGNISGANVTTITGITTTDIAIGNLIQEVDGIISTGTTVTSVGVSQVGISKTSLGAASSQEFLFVNQTPTGIVRVKGDLYVDGTRTEINSSTLTINDLNVIVASGATNGLTADGAGLVVDGADAHLKYHYNAGSNETFELNKNVGIGTDNATEKLDVRGHIKLDEGPVLEASSLQTSTALKISNTNGFIEIGPQNTGYGHIYTDRSRFYFNKKIIVDEGIIASYDEDLILRTNENTTADERIRILASNGYVGINTASPSTELDVNGEIKTVDINVASDANLKTNIKTIKDPLEKVLKIRGVTFDWKENLKSSAGVIAQEVEEVLPELVKDRGSKSVNYNGLIGLLIEAVKAQQEEINMLKERLK